MGKETFIKGKSY